MIDLLDDEIKEDGGSGLQKRGYLIWSIDILAGDSCGPGDS